ncbi:mitochondrial carrier [Leucogyrophana mollusca]|uniref:Mitochondrial carrier n=1 Tax=Leucogyrophana mollusca TaxID=85980 RepID=A0ACB8BLS0_9AGAM|nr:mitochondrial carrier [Leucogyrophana mollusca]
MLGIVNASILFAYFAVCLVFFFPLNGALVRIRAHYDPKGVQLQDDLAGVDAPPHTAPVPSFWGMLRRVRRIEGWGGLYKGMMPILVPTFFVVAVAALFLNDSQIPPERVTYSPADIPEKLGFSLGTMLVFLPLTIMSYRAIVIPASIRLPYFNALFSLRALLTPEERQRPWRLYTTPGLVATQFVEIIYTILAQQVVSQYIVPNLPRSGSAAALIAKIFVFVAVVLLSTAIINPLDVITVRLMVQWNPLASKISPATQEDGGDDDGNAVKETVIDLRTGRGSYTGLVGCAKTIIAEEGWGALYRVWWLTMLGWFAAFGIIFAKL